MLEIPLNTDCFSLRLDSSAFFFDAHATLPICLFVCVTIETSQIWQRKQRQIDSLNVILFDRVPFAVLGHCCDPVLSDLSSVLSMHVHLHYSPCCRLSTIRVLIHVTWSWGDKKWNHRTFHRCFCLYICNSSVITLIWPWRMTKTVFLYRWW